MHSILPERDCRQFKWELNLYSSDNNPPQKAILCWLVLPLSLSRCGRFSLCRFRRRRWLPRYFHLPVCTVVVNIPADVVFYFHSLPMYKQPEPQHWRLVGYLQFRIICSTLQTNRNQRELFCTGLYVFVVCCWCWLCFVGSLRCIFLLLPRSSSIDPTWLPTIIRMSVLCSS